MSSLTSEGTKYDDLHFQSYSGGIVQDRNRLLNHSQWKPAAGDYTGRTDEKVQ